VSPVATVQLGWGRGESASSSAAVGATSSTLDDLIERLWEGLWSADGSPCPLCGGTLRVVFGAVRTHVGRCDRCGSVLS
jgi:hypothetical protein